MSEYMMEMLGLYYSKTQYFPLYFLTTKECSDQKKEQCIIKQILLNPADLCWIQ